MTAAEPAVAAARGMLILASSAREATAMEADSSIRVDITPTTDAAAASHVIEGEVVPTQIGPGPDADRLEVDPETGEIVDAELWEGES